MAGIDSPPIYISQNSFRIICWMHLLDICGYPRYKVVLKRPFNNLV